MRSKLLLHPFLFSSFPVLALLATNITELHSSAGYRSLVGILLFTSALLLIVRLISRDWLVAAVLTTITIGLIFSYGHLYSALKSLDSADLGWVRHRFLLAAYAILYGLFILGVFRYKKSLPQISQAFNVFGILLVGVSFFQLLSFELVSKRAEWEQQTDLAATFGVSMPEDETPPDVYFIILDAYARDDQLAKQLGFDNTPFLEEMRALGFYVPLCSRSNYTLTELSLTSAMNFSYLQDMGLGLDRTALYDKAVFDNTIRRDSRVLRIFEELGYSIVAFETGFRRTEIETADYYYSPNRSWLDLFRSGEDWNAFEALLLRTTIALPILERELTAGEDIPREDQVVSGARQRYELIKYVFDTLETVPDIDGPTFTFAHLVVPHESYVLAPDGSFLPVDNVREGYLNQVQYVNARLVAAIQTILENSASPPVILVQADHGGPYPEVPDRIFTLAAYYLPETDDSELSELLTPVNLFRFVFNTYFGAELPLLENKSYFSTYYWPYDFTQPSEERPGCEQSGQPE